ncbi:ATP-binding cassette domain-containing protein [Corynebacterium poyangense]|uniref:ATP-binding cassette domain-containing protein n=1 Tax=Corynebacterium poyangense TaxID=2684405 RepID=A0A7H0SKY6_9CORY|nr:ABC transporter ATP-binding protein [Corynebacterium poyangense]QNQ89211.1 ATP-binding cassette domain-containing protein [Corynebacterium poyangense]
MEPVVLSNVSFRYSRKDDYILQDLSFQAGVGELWCLLGSSGSGKSTMIRLLMGLNVPTSGTVQVFGECAPFRTMRPRIGYMPQDSALYNDLTGRENLHFFGELSGVKHRELSTRAAELLDFFDLTNAADRLVSKYSGGMQRRLSLAIALMAKPDLLVLDEPTVGLDPRQRLRIWNQLFQMNADGVTILITTHVMDEAERCPNVALLADGHIIGSGSPQEICQHAGKTRLEGAFLQILDGERIRREKHLVPRL